VVEGPSEACSLPPGKAASCAEPADASAAARGAPACRLEVLCNCSDAAVSVAEFGSADADTGVADHATDSAATHGDANVNRRRTSRFYKRFATVTRRCDSGDRVVTSDLAIARPLSGRQAATMAYKLLADRRTHIPIRRTSKMTDRHGWAPASLADDEEGDDEEDEDDDE
jgi:hypothetical protein